MENVVQVFNNSEFGEVRTVNVNGEYWFVGKDVAEKLGYAKPQNAIANHVDEDDTLKQGIIDKLGRNQETTLINESGLYSLILKSKLPQAKSFKRWVTSEVLPSLRKSGTYSITTQQPNEMVANLVQSTMTAILPVITTEMAKVTIQNQQQINQVVNLLHDQSVIYDDDRSKIKDLIGFRSVNTSRMVNTIKEKLSDKLGRKIMASNPIFTKTKKEVFKEYEVIKWEDIPVEKYNNVFAFVDTYIEDLNT